MRVLHLFCMKSRSQSQMKRRGDGPYGERDRVSNCVICVRSSESFDHSVQNSRLQNFISIVSINTIPGKNNKRQLYRCREKRFISWCCGSSLLKHIVRDRDRQTSFFFDLKTSTIFNLPPSFPCPPTLTSLPIRSLLTDFPCRWMERISPCPDSRKA